MAGNTFHVEVVTQERRLYAGEAVSLVAPGATGSFGVLANHQAMITTLGVGELRITDATGHQRLAALMGGFFEVSNNKAIVLADKAEWAEEIDVPRAQSALTRVDERLTLPAAAMIDRSRADLAKQRARLRLKLAAAAGKR